MRPVVLQLESYPEDVVATSDGGFAVLASDIHVFDRALAPRERFPGPGRATTLVALADGRFIARERTMTQLVLAGVETVLFAITATREGWIGLDVSRAWLDRGSIAPAAWIATDVVGAASGASMWGERIVITGLAGLDVFEPDGTLAMRRRELLTKGTALALGEDRVAVPLDDGIAILDDKLETFAMIPCGKLDDMIVHDGSIIATGPNGVSAWTFDGTNRWGMPAADRRPAMPCGHWLVVAHRTKPGATIVEAMTGTIVAEVPTPGEVSEAVAFAGGIALLVRDHHAVIWWRPDEELVAIEHDVEPRFVRAVGERLVTAENKSVFVWSPTEDGPDFAPVATTMPIGERLAVGGMVVTIEHVGRVQLRGRLRSGKPVAIDPTLPWRPAMTRDEATVAMRKRVETRSIEDLHEIAAALDVNDRVVHASIRARKFPLVPPVVVPGYDYLGSFSTSGALVVSDPIYANKRAGGAISLAIKVASKEGIFHAFARNGEGSEVDRTAELVVIHKDGFESYATEPLGYIGNDTGTAGVFDKTCPKRVEGADFVEGIVGGLGVVTSSGYGDGTYNVYGGRNRNEIVKIRIAFIENGNVDRTFAAPKAAGRQYSAKETFVLGESIAHVKFGVGTVIRLEDGSKIEVEFADGARTLVHGKK